MIYMLLLGYRFTLVCYSLYATSGLSFHNCVLGFICYFWDIIPQLCARVYMLLQGYHYTIVC